MINVDHQAVDEYDLHCEIEDAARVLVNGRPGESVEYAINKIEVALEALSKLRSE